MAGWRDNLLPASFRGAEFFFNTHEYEAGRKNIFHEYPYRDEAEVEDQGTASDVFNITGYVLQSFSNQYDYFKDRDKLIDALKDSGSGQLIHRYLGEKNVALQGTFRMSEVFNNGGRATFQMIFKEVKKESAISSIADPISATDQFVADMNDVFADVFTTIMKPLANLQKVSNSVTAGMQAAIANIRQLKSIPGTIISTATGILLSTIALADTVLDSPCDLANAVIGGYDSFLFAAGMLDDTVNRDILGACSNRVQNSDVADKNSDELSQEEGSALTLAAADSSTFGDELSTITVTSPSSAEDLANQKAVINLIRGMGLGTACRIGVRTEFISQDDANELLTKVTTLMDDYLDYLGEEAGDSTLVDQGITFSNDEIYQSIKELKAVFKASMDVIGADLVKIINYNIGPEVISALTLAYDRYKDIDRDQEIIDRNALLIPNPCFLPNGNIINILSE